MNYPLSVTAFAPASVANVGCGFDIMGFALRNAGDTVTAKRSTDKSISISATGTYGHLLPSDPGKNTAMIAVKAMLKSLGENSGFILDLEKRLPLGSGMGSSASSAVAALTSVNGLLGKPFTPGELLPFAMESEKAASGTAHADNAAPSLLGGFVLIRSNNPPDIIRIQCPDDILCVVVHPHIQINTSDARRILRREIPISDAVSHSANSAGFIAGLLKGDTDLIRRSMNDILAEPRRINLIPGFAEAKRKAIGAGALGCGISGSGPSVFALLKGEENARSIAEIVVATFGEAGLESDYTVSSLNEPGARIIQIT
jgi:homoserine kinase